MKPRGFAECSVFDLLGFERVSSDLVEQIGQKMKKTNGGLRAAIHYSATDCSRRGLVTERKQPGGSTEDRKGKTVKVTEVRRGELTPRMGAAVSWMDKMWVMLHWASSSLSRASANTIPQTLSNHI